MRTKLQNKRLITLIEFLEKLPRKKFYFGSEAEEIKSNGETCATVACAIGWTPRIFPRRVKWEFAKSEFTDEVYFTGFTLDGETGKHYLNVAEELFGVPSDTDIFYPENQIHVDGLPKCRANATPKQVAKMLRKYMKLVP